MPANTLRLALAVSLTAACHQTRPESPAPAATPATAALDGNLYRLGVFTDGFREDRALDVPIGVPRPRPRAVASVEIGRVEPGDILLVTSAYMLESRLDGTNIGVATTIYLADHPGAYRDGDREILGFGSHNISNHGHIYPHYGTPSFSGIYRVAAGDERFRYVNLVTWVGTDDRRQAGKQLSLRRAPQKRPTPRPLRPGPRPKKLPRRQPRRCPPQSPSPQPQPSLLRRP